MRKIWMLFLAFIFFSYLVACSNEKKSQVEGNLWSFDPTKNDPLIEDNMEYLLSSYQEILKGLGQNDTLVIFEKTRLLVKLTDSMHQMPISKDTLVQKEYATGLTALQFELEGMVLEQSIPEIRNSFNMVTLHLLQLLGKMGYSKKTVYIFNTQETSKEEQEDGLYWLSLNKKSISPYNYIDNEYVSAIKILQEN